MISGLYLFAVFVGAVTIAYAVVMLLFAIGLRRLKRNRIVAPAMWPSVSVIVPARNEASVLPWALGSLLKQDYPGEWEVVVVDDRSDDDTPGVLAKLAERSSHLKFIRVLESSGASPKKQALAKGIASSRGEIIVTTDADCQYHSDWLRGLVCHMADDIGVVAGLTIFDLPDFETTPAWQKIQWLDFFVQNFLAAGSLGWGHAASCNGSNLCFRRQVYDEISGYGKSADVVSGDDVLFAQRVAANSKWKMVFATSPETIVKSLPVESVSGLMHQRLRWASKGLTYRGSMLAFLFAIYGYYCSLIALPVVSLFIPEMIVPALLIWIGKAIVDTVLIVTGARTFGQQRLLKYFPAYETLHVVFAPFFGFAGLLLPYHWKGDWYRTASLPKAFSGRWLRLRNDGTKTKKSRTKVLTEQ